MTRYCSTPWPCWTRWSPGGRPLSRSTPTVSRCRRRTVCSRSGSGAMVTRPSAFSSYDHAGDLSGQLRPIHQWPPRRGEASGGAVRWRDRGGGGKPREAGAAVCAGRAGGHDRGGGTGLAGSRGHHLPGPDGRLCALPERDRSRQGSSGLLGLRSGAATGLDESGSRPGDRHGLPHVRIRPDLRIVKYPEGRSESRWRRQPVRSSGHSTASQGEVPLKVDEVIDRLEYLVHHARGVPFSSQVMVDEEELLGLIDELRHHLPEEIKQANWTVQEQQRLIAEAHAEASRITARANERAQTAVQEHEVLRQVERQSQQTLRDAQERADQIVKEAEAYALEQLQQLEAHLSRTLATVKRGVEALHSSHPVTDGRQNKVRTSSPDRAWTACFAALQNLCRSAFVGSRSSGPQDVRICVSLATSK